MRCAMLSCDNHPCSSCATISTTLVQSDKPACATCYSQECQIALRLALERSSVVT